MPTYKSQGKFFKYDNVKGLTGLFPALFGCLFQLLLLLCSSDPTLPGLPSLPSLVCLNPPPLLFHRQHLANDIIHLKNNGSQNIYMVISANSLITLCVIHSLICVCFACLDNEPLGAGAVTWCMLEQCIAQRDPILDCT